METNPLLDEGFRNIVLRVYQVGAKGPRTTRANSLVKVAINHMNLPRFLPVTKGSALQSHLFDLANQSAEFGRDFDVWSVRRGPRIIVGEARGHGTSQVP